MLTIFQDTILVFDTSHQTKRVLLSLNVTTAEVDDYQGTSCLTSLLSSLPCPLEDRLTAWI
jgi:hypothetical protein